MCFLNSENAWGMPLVPPNAEELINECVKENCGWLSCSHLGSFSPFVSSVPCPSYPAFPFTRPPIHLMTFTKVEKRRPRKIHSISIGQCRCSHL
jgi:hypothetical protein